MILYFKLAVFVLLTYVSIVGARYEPTWDSLDKRPLPKWYDDAKFGVFIHWGVFSVPSFGSEWFWWYWKGSKSQDFINFMAKNYPPGFTYGDFAAQFKAEFFNPDQWANIFSAAGAKYIVLTSKHHEGFTNWPSKVSFNWNSMDVGPNRDLVGDLAVAVRKQPDLHFGLYHSLFEWFNPILQADRAGGFKTRKFVEQKTMPELFELISNYKPEVVWSDGDEGLTPEYWNATNFIAWLYNDSPVKDTVVVNDRWGDGVGCTHGDFYTCADRYNPGHLLKHKWENCMTVDQSSWGYRRNAPLSSYLNIEDLISSLITTVSCNGNLLLNVGPTSDGMIGPIYEERLRQMGEWLKVNGEAIYASRPWAYQNDTINSDVWYTYQPTVKGQPVYAMALKWPKSDTSGSVLELGAPTPSVTTSVTLLGYNGPLSWEKRSPTGIRIRIPPIPISLMPCRWAWTFRLDNVS